MLGVGFKQRQGGELDGFVISFWKVEKEFINGVNAVKYFMKCPLVGLVKRSLLEKTLRMMEMNRGTSFVVAIDKETLTVTTMQGFVCRCQHRSWRRVSLRRYPLHNRKV